VIDKCGSGTTNKNIIPYNGPDYFGIAFCISYFPFQKNDSARGPYTYKNTRARTYVLYNPIFYAPPSEQLYANKKGYVTKKKNRLIVYASRISEISGSGASDARDSLVRDDKRGTANAPVKSSRL